MCTPLHWLDSRLRGNDNTGQQGVQVNLGRIALLFGLCLSDAWGAGEIPPNVLQEWMRGVQIKGTQHVLAERIPASMHPVYLKEGDAEPVEYAFFPEHGEKLAKLLGDFAYIERPTPALRWRSEVQPLARIAKRWNTAAGEWAWNYMAAYRIKLGHRERLCVESAYAGIGRSGRMQYVRAVVVFTPGKRQEILYANGYMLECRALLVFPNDDSLGYIELGVDESMAGAYTARVWRLGPGRKRSLVQAYRLEAASAGDAGGGMLAREVSVTTGPGTERGR